MGRKRKKNRQAVQTKYCMRNIPPKKAPPHPPVKRSQKIRDKILSVAARTTNSTIPPAPQPDKHEDKEPTLQPAVSAALSGTDALQWFRDKDKDKDKDPSPEQRSGSAAEDKAAYERTLEDLYREHPGRRPGGMDASTMSLAGQTVRLVAEEATFHFLRRWCPEAKWPDVVRQMTAGGGEGPGGGPLELSVPTDAMDVQEGMSPVAEVLRNCRRALAPAPEVETPRGLVAIAEQTIMLCSLLRDDARRAVLVEAKTAFVWYPLCLECKIPAIRRRAARKLEDLNARFASRRDGDGLEVGEVDERAEQELEILTEAQAEFQTYRDEFSMNLMNTLKRVMVESRHCDNTEY